MPKKKITATTNLFIRVDAQLARDIQTERERREKAAGCKLSLNAVVTSLLKSSLMSRKREGT